MYMNIMTNVFENNNLPKWVNEMQVIQSSKTLRVSNSLHLA